MRVLLVEDEIKMSRAIRRGLEQEGYAVDAALDGNDGLHRATEWDYDAIVLDILLPGLDGIEVCRRLRLAGRWAPVLMLTARDRVADRISGLDVGADDYLVKPFAFGELLARLRALVRRGARERPAVLTVGELVLDPAAHVVSLSGRPVLLSAREFALLEFLMRRPGQVVSRTEILEHVWNYNYDGLSNVVDVYVGYLRRKLEQPPGLVHPHRPGRRLRLEPARARGRLARPPPCPGPPHGLVRGPAGGDPGHARLFLLLRLRADLVAEVDKGPRRPARPGSWPTPTAAPPGCPRTAWPACPAARRSPSCCPPPARSRPAGTGPGPVPAHPGDAAGVLDGHRCGPRCARDRTGRATGCSACAGRRGRCWRSRPR